ncbi:unnamed protein product [Strongylus vulgaris]|uniref:Uncharacterized protein n=1 Tax=Strongylus vulgaris TaxID=40348 RepID=A0A3P7I584_STRVU|nr:unnamed protein product [Strongylus vulgaris]
MATLHCIDDRLIICATSKIFSAAYSEERLDILDVFDVNTAISSVPVITRNSLDENKLISKVNVSDAYQVLCGAVSGCGSLLAVGISAKIALILDAKTLQLRRAFRIPKAPTSICFDEDISHVIIGDRSGHVCRYTVEMSNKSGYVDMNGEESLYEGEPLSSAISMVLDVAISQDGRFLLAADRDEKIRVSRYPQAFVVQSFCLGHSAYVSSIASYGTRVFSSGGDATVHEWNIENGSSIAHSDKLGDKPVRKLCILARDNLLNVVAVGGNVIHLLDDKLNLLKSVSTTSEIMDVAVHDMKIFTISGCVPFRFSGSWHN